MEEQWTGVTWCMILLAVGFFVASWQPGEGCGLPVRIAALVGQPWEALAKGSLHTAVVPVGLCASDVVAFLLMRRRVRVPLRTLFDWLGTEGCKWA